MIPLGSSGIPLPSVMSAVGQLVCAAEQGGKMGEELRVCPCCRRAASIRGRAGLGLSARLSAATSPSLRLKHLRIEEVRAPM